MSSPPHVVVIGAGFGGLAAARRLRRAPVRVTLIDRHNYHLFQPLLYQVATATLSPGDIASPVRWILRRATNIRVLLGEAASIDPGGRTVTLTDGAAIPYDYLIVATGASHSYFGHEEWAQHAPGLKTLEDALEIRKRVLLAFERAEREVDPERQRRLLTFVLVGGGPTGVELAGTLAEIARQTLRHEYRSIDTRLTRIVLVEAGNTILPSFPYRLRDAARRSLKRLGIEVLESARVTSIDARGVMLQGTLPSGSARPDERIVAGTVLWAAGVAASPLVATLGAPRDRAGRVMVQPDLTIPRHPEVFVVGDTALLLQEGHPLPGVAQVAMQQAAYAASVIAAEVGPGASPGSSAARTPFVYHDKGSMAIVGRGAAIADLGRFHFAGLPAWFAWLFLHIFMLVGFRNRVAVMFEWAMAFLTYQRSVRLITGEQGGRSGVGGGPDP